MDQRVLAAILDFKVQYCPNNLKDSLIEFVQFCMSNTVFNVRSLAAILDFAYKNIPHLRESHPSLVISLPFIDDESIEKRSYALHGHGTVHVRDDPTKKACVTVS